MHADSFFLKSFVVVELDLRIRFASSMAACLSISFCSAASLMFLAAAVAAAKAAARSFPSGADHVIIYI